MKGDGVTDEEAQSASKPLPEPTGQRVGFVIDRGQAGDALDYALDQIADSNLRQIFLEDWRGCPDYPFEHNWVSYLLWLQVQRDGAAEAKRREVRSEIVQAMQEENEVAAQVNQASLEKYALALLGEEMSEAGAILGKIGRFGIDTEAPDRDPYNGRTGRELLTIEVGDVAAAIDYLCDAGVIDRMEMRQRRIEKYLKLCDPDEKDNLGRRLAPPLPGKR